MRSMTIFFSLWLFLPLASALAQTAPLPVDTAFAFSANKTAAGGLELRWEIADGYYLYRDRIAAQTTDGRTVPMTTPAGEPKDDPYFGRMEVYHRSAEASAEPAAIADLGDAPAVTVSYQGCQDDGICYRPQTKTFDLAALSAHPTTPGKAEDALNRLVRGESVWKRPSVSAAGDETSVATANAPASSAPQAGTPVATTISNLPQPSAGTPGIAIDRSNRGFVADLLADGGAAWVVAMFFVLGLGLAFTPCVLPMYPILAGQLSRGGERLSAGRGFVVSATYVGAMAAAFGLLGVAAAWSGQNLQIALQSKAAILFVSALFVVLALSMFGLFELRLPAAWTNAIARKAPGSRGSLSSSAALGFTSALIVGPCVTAPLAGGLLYIAQTGDVGLGAVALSALGLGQGIPLIVFGTIGSRALPKAGRWMVLVTRAFGFAFLGLAIWMMSRILPPTATLGLWSALLLGAGVFLGALDVLGSEAGVPQRLAKAGGFAAMLYGAILAVGAAAGADDPLRPLASLATAGPAAPSEKPIFRKVRDSADMAALVRAADRPSLIYTTAEWCVTCKVIERNVFGDPTVRAELAGFQLLELDLTEDDPARTALMKELDVVGPPTMLFVDNQAREVPGSRLIGDITASGFLAAARLAEGS